VVQSSKIFYVFSPDLEPAAKAKVGDKVIFYTLDALGGQITSEDQVITSIDFSRVNPATGPLYIEGAEPGDALLVKILSINTSERGFVVTAPNAGALPNMVKEAKTRACYVRGDYVEFMGFKLPTRKMVGVIGVASSERTPTGLPGKHGGNLDTRFVTEGSTVILPVEYPGALLGIGDVHATMGDGEVCVSACEVSAEVAVEVNLIKGLAPMWPVVQYGDYIHVLVSNEKMDKALEEGIDLAVKILSLGLNLSWDDSYMMASLAVDIGVSQLVNPKKTIRIQIPSYLLPLENILRTLNKLREYY